MVGMEARSVRFSDRGTGVNPWVAWALGVATPFAIAGLLTVAGAVYSNFTIEKVEWKPGKRRRVFFSREVVAVTYSGNKAIMLRWYWAPWWTRKQKRRYWENQK